MPKNVEYRILEQESDGRWIPFAIAYRRGSGFALFSSGWRSHQNLVVNSLDELSNEHYPTSNFLYRWSDVGSCNDEVKDAIDLFDWAVENRTIKLLVTDLSESSVYTNWIPFKVQPGLDDEIIIPRHLLGQECFPSCEENRGPSIVVNAAEEPVVGREFRATVALSASSSQTGVLTSNSRRVVIAEFWNNPHGLIGCNVLDSK
jgi:hypothetical protein